MKQVKLGYEVGSGKEVKIQPSHLIVTGLSALSGKTTCLEALINRSKAKAVVFKTKPGEKGFTKGTLIPPFFKERCDWEYVESLLEATMREKMKFERSWIIDATKGANSLLEVKKNIDDKLKNDKLRALDKGIFTTLQAYFDKILPQLQYAKFSNTLDLNEGINIMDLERFSDEVKSLIIRSVIEKVLKERKNTIVVIPEAWNFLPQGRGNPCKETAISFIRQGATQQNFLWIDSQDITGVDKTILKQVSTWIMGKQMELNEVKRTLDQLPVSKKQRPKPEEIMQLKVGHFYACSPNLQEKIVHTYVEPSWLDKETAKAVAKGKVDVQELKAPTNLAPFAVQSHPSTPASQPSIAPKNNGAWRSELAETRNDFFDKAQGIQENMDALASKVLDIELQVRDSQPNLDEIVSKVLQKMPVRSNDAVPPINEEELVRRVLARVPSGGGKTYEVAPLELIRKKFLEEAKSKVLADVSSIDDEQKKMLKYIEAQGKGQPVSTIVTKCLFKTIGGSIKQATLNKLKQVSGLELLRYDNAHGKFHPCLKETIVKYCSQHGATEQEIQQVYDHIMHTLLGGEQ